MSEPRILGQHKIQFIYSEAQWRRLERLTELCEGSPKSNVDREAHRIYEALLDAVLEGKRLFFEDSAGTRTEVLNTDIIALRSKVERGEAEYLRRPSS